MHLVTGPTDIPNVVNATVSMTVKVTERNFSDDLRNTSSQAYKDFINLFLSQVGTVTLGKGRAMVTHHIFSSVSPLSPGVRRLGPLRAPPHSGPIEAASAPSLSPGLYPHQPGAV